MVSTCERVLLLAHCRYFIALFYCIILQRNANFMKVCLFRFKQCKSSPQWQNNEKSIVFARVFSGRFNT